MKKRKLDLVRLAHTCFCFKYFFIKTVESSAKNSSFYQRKLFGMLRLSQRIEIISTDDTLNVYHGSLKLDLITLNFFNVHQKLPREKKKHLIQFADIFLIIILYQL